MKLIDLNAGNCSVFISFDGEEVTLTKSQIVELIKKTRELERRHMFFASIGMQQPDASRSKSVQDAFSLDQIPIEKESNSVPRIAAILREMMKSGAPLNDNDQQRLVDEIDDAIRKDSIPKKVNGRLGFSLRDLVHEKNLSEALKNKIHDFLEMYPQLTDAGSIVARR